MTGERVLQLRADRVSWSELDEEVVILDLDTSRYLRLNETGALLWKELQTPATVEQLHHRLLDAYDVDEEEARAGVASFITQLEEYGLLLS